MGVPVSIVEPADRLELLVASLQPAGPMLCLSRLHHRLSNLS
jgi:hypothetical protein